MMSICAHSQWVRVLAGAIEIGVLWKSRPQAHVLVLEDQGGRRRVEQDVTAAPTLDGEAEWFFDVFEHEFARRILRATRDWSWKDRTGHLVDLLGGIFDQDMESGVSQSC